MKLIKDTLGYHIKDLDGYKLSLKNCQAIELRYDLDELAETFAKNHSIYPTAQDDTEYGFKNGFQKALEIIGDNKFSEDELKLAFFHVQNEPTFDVFKQSLQQTEWDVEIEIKNVIYETKIVGAIKGVKGSGNKITTYKQIPKLDADGCLILKRI